MYILSFFRSSLQEAVYEDYCQGPAAGFYLNNQLVAESSHVYGHGHDMEAPVNYALYGQEQMAYGRAQLGGGNGESDSDSEADDESEGEAYEMGVEARDG